MAKPTYYELLKHPNWQRKRLEVMERAGFRCEECDGDGTTLNVHHSYYEKGCDPWDYPTESLHCLCEACHKEADEVRRSIQRQIGKLSLAGMRELFGYACGLSMIANQEVECVIDDADKAQGLCSAYAFSGTGSKVFKKRLDYLISGLSASGNNTIDGMTVEPLLDGCFAREEWPEFVGPSP
jgi:hypothetical protein